MQSHVFKKQPVTPHFVKRRTLVDESLIEAMIQTHLRPTETAGASFATAVETSKLVNVQQNQREPSAPPNEPGRSIWDDNLLPGVDFSDFANPPQTPRRESRTLTTAPGSGRRTPRRRSRSSNQHLRTTPIKALADANEARVNRLISEANKRGRVGRDKHSPMGILRQLSRLPGFNPPPKPSPDREPIPGSANWRKLTPRSTRTRHIDLTGDVTNPFKSISSNRKSLRESDGASTSTDHAGSSSAKRRAIDRFKDDNPFLTEEDYSQLWEEEIDAARNQLAKGRDSFGSGFPSADRDMLADDDTRDLSFANEDYTDPFLDQAELREKSADIGDITGHSTRGFETREAQDERKGRTLNSLAGAQGGVDLSKAIISTHDGGIPLAAGQADAHEDSNRGIEYAVEGPGGAAHGKVMGRGDSHETGGGGSGQEKNIDIDVNDGWEDIPDDELTQDFLSQQGLQTGAQETAASGVADDSIGAVTDKSRNNSGVDGDVDNADLMDKMNQDLAVIDNEDLEMAGLNEDEQDANVGRLNEQTQDADRLLDDAERADQDIDEQLDDADKQDQDVDEHLDEADRLDLDVNEHSDDADRLLQDMDDQLDDADKLGQDVDEQLDDPDKQDQDHDIGDHNQDTPAAGDQDPSDANEGGQDLEIQNDQEFEDGYMNVNEEDHVEQQEHEEQQDKSGVQYYDDFPSELGIMSNGNVLPTSLPKTKKVVRRSRAGIPVPSMPTSLQKQLIHTFSRSRMSREAMDVILEGSHLFFEQASNDLAAYANHAGRKTVDESDVELLMRRLRIIHDKVSMESLLQRYLPRELRDKVLFPDDMPNANARRR
ncbi:hypothetical protein BGX24_010640 [Mortierella sp. AD032]|nr:hypothetical protein BGX24_010640 [Mortierella sp. AD032]